MTNKVNILVPVKYPVGGIRTYLKYTYGNLDRNKYSFTLLGLDPDWLKLIKNDLQKHEVNLVLGNEKENTFGIGRLIFKALLASKFDIIHSQGYTSGVIASLVNLLFRIPHIITLHHVFNAGQYSDTFWQRHVWVKRFTLERILNRADVIQSVSLDARENILSTFPLFRKKPDKIVVIPNGVDVDTFVNNGKNNEVLLGGYDNTFIIGFLGRYMPEKGFPHLIEAVDYLVKQRKVKDFKVLSIGGFGGFIREYKKEVNRRGLTQYFEFLGFVENVYHFLTQVHAVVIPSLGEAAGIVSMEALIAGVPVVAFSCIGLREVLADTPAIMVPVGDYEAMANEVVRVKKDYENIKRGFEDFIPKAKERYSVDNTSKKLEEVFSKLIKG